MRELSSKVQLFKSSENHSERDERDECCEGSGLEVDRFDRIREVVSAFSTCLGKCV